MKAVSVVQRSAFDFFPEKISYRSLKSAAAECMGCDLYKLGRQTVFGEGRTTSEVMFVGEQPGDEEDKTGHPFVGPAGRMLDKALEEAGIDRDKAYVTNVVKHFKWAPRGKRRIHEKPNAAEVRACSPWLKAEIQVVSPRVLVCLGATASRALLGKSFRVSQERGRFVPSALAPFVTSLEMPLVARS